MNTKTTSAIVGAAVAMSLVANAAMSPQSGASKPQEKFKALVNVFILAGQSNMQGHARVSTFEHMGMDPAAKPMLAEMQNADGSPKVCEWVWISSIGSKKLK